MGAEPAAIRALFSSVLTVLWAESRPQIARSAGMSFFMMVFLLSRRRLFGGAFFFVRRMAVEEVNEFHGGGRHTSVAGHDLAVLDLLAIDSLVVVEILTKSRAFQG